MLYLTTESTIGELEQLQVTIGKHHRTQSPDSLIKTIINKAIPLTLQTKIEKARMNSFELMSHLEAKSLETKNSKEHYQKIIQNMTGVDNSLCKHQHYNILESTG